MLINGERTDQLQADNRGLAYGDGVFETLRIHRQRLVFRDQHFERLGRGLEQLGINDCCDDLVRDLESSTDLLPDSGVLKILVSRGAGGRGYRSTAGSSPDRVMTLHALPAPVDESGIQVFQCKTGLSHNPMLAGIKHLNRLEQVLASANWPGEAFHEGLMLDPDGLVIEGTRSNIFMAIDGNLFTPDLSRCGIEGVLRRVLLETIPEARIGKLPLDSLSRADEIFFCNSVAGIWPVLSVHLADGQVISRPRGKFTTTACEIFSRALESLE